MNKKYIALIVFISIFNLSVFWGCATVDIKITYAVLNPSVNTETKIREIREITYNGDLVGRPEVSQFRSDGTFTSTIPLYLPAAAQKGRYTVRVTIESDNAKDTRETRFTVS